MAAAATLLFIVYAVASRWAVTGHDPVWAILPLGAGIGLVVALNAPRRPFAALALTAALLAAAIYWRPLWLVYLPPTLLDLLFAWLFGRTLAAGQVPLIEQFMRLEYGELPPWLARHARRVTWIWTVVLVLLGAVAAALAVRGEAMAWVIFVNLVSYLVMAALFLIEYGYRRLFFPPGYHISPLGVFRVVQRSRLIRVSVAGDRPA